MQYKDTLMWQELNATPHILETLAEKNKETLERIAAAICAKKPSNVYTAARGTSDHAMIFFKYLVESTSGYPVASGAPSAVTVYGAKLKLENSLVVACSQSGKAADVMEVVKCANACGGITVAVTNDEQSPLAKLAQFHLCCFAGEEKSVAATKTFCAQLYLSLLLAQILAGKEGKGYPSLGQALAKDAKEIDAATDKMADAFVQSEECFLLSRGVSSAIAFECGLKLQETCYIRARAYHSSDFYHGPMAMVGEGTKVILFASKKGLNEASEGVHREDFLKCADKMLELGADLYVITDDAACFAEKGAHVVEVPGGESEELTMFRFAMAAQMLACKVSCGKGRNPDSPRALKKVTVTK